MPAYDTDLSFGRAPDLAGGAPGSIPYQVSSTSTEFIDIGTTGTVLTSNGSTATWEPITGKIIVMSMIFGG